MKIHEFIWYRIIVKITDVPRQIKWFLQRVFRGYDDTYLWGFCSSFVKEIYPKFKAFCAMEKHGLASCYFENPEKVGHTDEDFEKAFENYNAIMNEILFAFEWILYDEEMCNKKFKRYFEEKYGNPYEEIESNRHEPLKCAVINEDGTEKEKFLLGDDPVYYNLKMIDEFGERAEKGFELFGKYLFTFWD